MRHLGRRRLVWLGLYVTAVGVLALLLVLVGTGTLRLPSRSPGPSVTVSSVNWSVLEGQIPNGRGWFGPAEFNYTSATGWKPATFSSGGRLQISWGVVNYDNTTHQIYSVTVSPPFELAGTGTPLPMFVGIGDDGNTLVVYVTTSSSTSGTFPLAITVNALSSG